MKKGRFILKPLGMMIAMIGGILLFFSFCSRMKYDVIPDSYAIYHSAVLKVNVRVKDSRKRQNFKIVLKYDDSRDKMLFLSPMNQVYGQLFIKNETALLINTKKRKYWKGDFNRLIREIWALDFTYFQFKELILTGRIPQRKVEESGLQISLEKEEESEKPKRIKIDHRDMTVKIKISSRRKGKGIINFSPRLEKVKKATIEEILE
jgi:hypothetical protein